MICSFETCHEPATDGRQCTEHAEMLRRSRAFWTPGKLTLDPMSPSQAQLGLAGSNMELPR